MSDINLENATMVDFIPMPTRQGRGGGRWNHNNNRGGRGRGFNGGRGRGGRGRGWLGRGGRGRGGRGGGGTGFGKENEIFEETGTPTETSVSIAVEGCCHGELDAIYSRIKDYEGKGGRKVDLLICCGDFQSLRTHSDFHSFAAPPKYRQLGSFVKYYSGAAVAPVLTLFVGGNHENSQQLQELYYGGWVAPNIYYMGAAGIVNFKGVRIGGISGIFKYHDYNKGHFERPPYDRSTLRSVYHVRNLEVYRMKCLDKERRLDVMISHDWPQGIETYGNTNELLRRKPFFRDEVNTNTLGSPPNREILEAIKPKHWFSAHLHVGFKATLNHGSNATKIAEKGETSKSPASAVAGLVPSQTVKSKAGLSPSHDTTKNKATESSGGDSVPEKNEPVTAKSEEAKDKEDMLVCQPVDESITTFVSLDKCLPGRAYLSIVHVEATQDSSQETNSEQLEYDVEWLAILRKTHQLAEPSERRQRLPEDSGVQVSTEEIDLVRQKLLSRTGSELADSRKVPNNFARTVPAPPAGYNPRPIPPPLPLMGNPQTDELLQLLDLEHILTIPYDPNCLDGLGLEDATDVVDRKNEAPDNNEIDIDDDDLVEGDAEGEWDESHAKGDKDKKGDGMGARVSSGDEAVSPTKRPRVGSSS